MEYTRLFRLLSDRTRLRILALLGGGPLCVCHIVEVLDEPQAKISKQLGQLRAVGLINVTRERNWSVYRIADDLPEIARQVLAAIDAHLYPDEQLIGDQERRQCVIERLREDPGNCPRDALAATTTGSCA